MYCSKHSFAYIIELFYHFNFTRLQLINIHDSFGSITERYNLRMSFHVTCKLTELPIISQFNVTKDLLSNICNILMKHSL